MPIKLNNRWKAGSIDSDAEYPQLKIVEFRMGLEHYKYLMLCVEFGNTIDGKWVKGKTGHFQVLVEDTPDDPAFTRLLDRYRGLRAGNKIALYECLQILEPEKTNGDID